LCYIDIMERQEDFISSWALEPFIQFVPCLP
jgi:hypothetical protein